VIEHALALAARGFYVFPIQGGKKMPPLIKDFPTMATRDAEEIRIWWALWPNANIGISTSTFGDGEALLVVDVDTKGDKDGNATIFELELAGNDFPDTYTQSTPTGGRHLVYRVPAAVKQSAGKIGRGLDIRSRGGYIVGVGSRVAAGTYADVGGRVGPAPDWLVARCGSDAGRKDRDAPRGSGADIRVDAAAAVKRARAYLEGEAALAVEGQGGNATTYAVACRVRDFGVADRHMAASLMVKYWNDRCSPPWDMHELTAVVRNAYEYAQDAPGNAAPEAVFKPFTEREQGAKAEHPFTILNKDHAFVIAGGGHHILWETSDAKGRPELVHLSIGAFHAKHAAWKMQIGKKASPVTMEWMESTERRGYDGICFAPEKPTPANFYNLWRGFAVQPAESGEHPAVKRWLEHCRLNVCQGDEKLHAWLIGYFAHMIQKPWEKPLVALVFRGGKGVGKNALVGAIGNLLGGHYLLSSNRRYLVGNFNGHLENLLLFVLDEAFWSGDKQAEGTLKDLITGASHVIEHKGKEPYAVDNLTRVAIIGNENWLVPASHDERRFAVFNVGDGRKQDRNFFSGIARGMESGGAACLLRYLLTYDLSVVDVNAPPASAGLLDQKHESLAPLAKYWLACLQDGMLQASEFGTEWPTDKIEVERFATAYRRWLRDNNMPVRLPTHMFKELRAFAPGTVRGRMRVGNSQPYGYQFQPLAQARAEWEQHIGQPVKWEH
jgi:hypothetical protein